MRFLREIRDMRGLTQKELAEEVGTTAMTISRLEHGRQDASFSLALMLAQALEVPVEALATGLKSEANRNRRQI